MAELRYHPYRPRLITLEDEIRRLRRYVQAVENAEDLSKPISVPLGMLRYLGMAVDALEDQLPEQPTSDQNLPRYGMYL